MDSRGKWFGAWAAVSALWVIYWTGMTLALGAEAIREVIAEMSWPPLVGALFVFVPAGLYSIGVLVAWILRQVKGDAP